eukprot:2524183-Rhodomonas_salina.2
MLPQLQPPLRSSCPRAPQAPAPPRSPSSHPGWCWLLLDGAGIVGSWWVVGARVGWWWVRLRDAVAVQLLFCLGVRALSPLFAALAALAAGAGCRFWLASRVASALTVSILALLPALALANTRVITDSGPDMRVLAVDVPSQETRASSVSEEPCQ